ncbi:hypothetical protein [Nocardia gipuzkoensis]
MAADATGTAQRENTHMNFTPPRPGTPATGDHRLDNQDQYDLPARPSSQQQIY